MIAGAAGVATGLVVIAMLVEPVSVRLRVPLAEASVVVSPKYCALILCVPTLSAGAVGVAVPPLTVAAVPIIVPLSKS